MVGLFILFSGDLDDFGFEVGEVHAHPQLSISFLNHHHVCQSIGVVNLPNETYLLKFADFFSYGLISLRGEHLLLLSDGWKGGLHIQPMYHD